MQKIKLIALDLDGTLLNDKKKISSKSICAMKKLINKGIYIVPTSGRISNDEIVQKETCANRSKILYWREWWNYKGLY